MSLIIGVRPLKKNSTAITITIKPINFIKTLLPVGPKKREIRVALIKTK